MPTITFNAEKDKELLKKLDLYCKQHNMQYRVEAVRRLCEDALILKKISK